MTRIYLVRHAEAEGNLFRRIHGQYDTTVTYNGLRQIRALEQRFAGERIDACYSSDLVRTRTTAQAVWVPRGLPLHLDARFREVRLGRWEDVPFGQLEREDPEEMARFNRDPYHWSVEGAETFDVYSGRFLEGLTEVARRHDGQTVAIFTHGCVLRAVQQRLFYPPEAIGQIAHCDNTGVSLVEYDGGTFRSVYLNDNSHLSPEISTFARQNWWRSGGTRQDHNLWFRPMGDDPRWYAACRQDAWENVYGPGERLDGEAYYREARDRAAGEREALCEAMLGDARIGLLELDPLRDARSGVGYVPFLYLLPEYRGRGLGIQLIGQAVSFFRARGRTHLQLSVSPQNAAALAFYRKYGFTQVGATAGAFGQLLRLDLNVDLSRDLEPERRLASV